MQIMKNKKGISPVIAVILLVGVAIGASAMAYSWFSGIQSGTQEASGATAGQVALASGANVKIDYINSTHISLRNIGSSTLTGIQISGLTATGFSGVSLGAGTVNYSTYSGASSGVTTVRVTTNEGASATYQLVR